MLLSTVTSLMEKVGEETAYFFKPPKELALGVVARILEVVARDRVCEMNRRK